MVANCVNWRPTWGSAKSTIERSAATEVLILRDSFTMLAAGGTPGVYYETDEEA